mmetsp:Transcript_87749/g.183430  ORF Transcript_87749/g.183430 Transcript_87749/m.183430 type:complete len:478 (-) Transcript_87749:249-1682(-)|eukprot:CAMPEP_0206436280 /NCGR_PEP_ID=MMETSP0324_2-20121206/10389_1 /ASSEMBLY_ACC=CAM_ASM_000836 /TAXON_ID=2866 /ORGANISM="Crypthecodinium cohnii, Strain Seligo" /LENGTH=477 /DNA_ID=CAMNT_0053903415 /DNA_START=61 /DNA_END=1494 /DNA_ORIENTATION=+
MQGLAYLDEGEEQGEPWEVRIERDWQSCEFAPEELLKDHEFMSKIVKISGYAFEFADEELKEDPKLCLEAVRHSFGDAMQWVPPVLHRNRPFMLACVAVSADVMRFVSNKAYNDEGAKIKSVDGVFYCWRRGGKEGIPFVTGPCTPQNGKPCESCANFLSDPDNCPLPQDRGFMKEAVKLNWMCLKYATDELKGEREIVMLAVQSGGWALSYASEALQTDREVALAATKQNWQVFKVLARKLRVDAEIAEAAIRQDWHAIKLVAKELKTDVNLARIAVEQSWISFQFLPKELRAMRELALLAVQQDWKAFQHMGKDLKSDKELALVAVKQSGSALELVSDSLQADREVAHAAVQQDWAALQFVSNSLKSDEALVLQAVKANGFALKFAAEDLKCREVLVQAAQQQQFAALEVAVHPRHYEADGLDFEFWKSFSEDSGIKGRLKPVVPVGELDGRCLSRQTNRALSKSSTTRVTSKGL